MPVSGGAPSGGETTLVSGSQLIGSGVDEVDVVFPEVYSETPVIAGLSVERVDLTVDSIGIQESNSLTTAGFTAMLSAETGAANKYKLHWSIQKPS